MPLRCARAALVLLALVASGPALARSNGIAAEGCNGCHSSSNEATLDLQTNPGTFAPGTQVEVLVTIAGSGVVAGGVYISTEGVGALEALPGEGLAPVVSGLVHVDPLPASSGEVEFRFAWTAPASPGAVRFYVYGLGTNGNGQRSGDSPAEGMFDRVYGCDGQEYFFDGDGDGFGRSTGQALLACAGAPPPNHADNAVDCIDYDAAIHPTAAELCNLKDDDCNGQVDENAVPIELWPDGDGDGFYDKKEGESVVGCVGLKGYAAFAGDCDPLDAAIHPDAEETCNYRDDDCDGEADDRVRPICGEGWCRRSSATCDAEDCYPGTPTDERCNYLDDDCDGEIDEGELCASGETCLAGECVPTDSLVVPDGGAPAPGSGGTSASAPRRSSTDSGCSAAALGTATQQPWILALLTAALALRRLNPWRRGRSRRAA